MRTAHLSPLYSSVGLIALHCLYAAPRGTSAGANKAPAAPAPAAKIEVENAGPAPASNPSAPPATATAAAFAAGHTAEFEIEDDVPLPVKRVGVKGQSAYPYAKLNVGQSFFVPVSEKMAEPWKTLTSLSSRMTRDHWPKRFVTERGKNAAGIEGVRVWRQSDGEGPTPPEKRKSPAKKDAPATSTGDAPSGDATTGAAPAETTATAAE